HQPGDIGFAQRGQLLFLLRCPLVEAVDDAEQLVRARPVVGPMGVFRGLGGVENMARLAAGQIEEANRAHAIDNQGRRPVEASHLKCHTVGGTCYSRRVREDHVRTSYWKLRVRRYNHELSVPPLEVSESIAQLREIAVSPRSGVENDKREHDNLVTK